MCTSSSPIKPRTNTHISSDRECGADEVRLSITYCGICGTDIGEYRNGPIFPPQHGVTHPYTGASLPITLGHEFVGTIIELGSSVKNLKLGQAVAVNPACDHRHFDYDMEPCNPCRNERYNICDATATYGLAAPGGGFSEESVVNAMNCIPIPPGVSMEAAALMEPLAVAHHCITEAGFQKGQTGLICGAGPIGLALLSILRVLGASKIFVTEILETRLTQAKEFGADVVINPQHTAADADDQTAAEQALASIRGHTGDGVDVAFDATGVQSSLDLAIAGVKPRGTVFNVAIHKKPLQIHLNSLTFKEKRLMGGISYVPGNFDAVMDMLADGSLDATRLITAIIPLSKIIHGGFEELINNSSAHVKILVQPNQK